jgi:hypothetical protein
MFCSDSWVKVTAAIPVENAEAPVVLSNGMSTDLRPTQLLISARREGRHRRKNP